MSASFLKDAFLHNWYWMCGALICLGIPILSLVNPSNDDTTKPTTQTAETAPIQLSPEPEAPEQPVSRQQNVIAVIETHRAQITAEPDSPDAPALWVAMGNLYRQRLMDYAKAVECYTTALEQYPQWDGRRQIYVQLATCYERLNDHDNARWIYQKMMNEFPQDTQEYQFAEAKLFERVN